VRHRRTAFRERVDEARTEHDRRIRVQIEDERRRRRLALSELDTVREEREEELRTVQKLVREVVKGRLEAVSATYDRLDRAAADSAPGPSSRPASPPNPNSPAGGPSPRPGSATPAGRRSHTRRPARRRSAWTACDGRPADESWPYAVTPVSNLG
jgi:hypothetical protein